MPFKPSASERLRRWHWSINVVLYYCKAGRRQFSHSSLQQNIILPVIILYLCEIFSNGRVSQTTIILVAYYIMFFLTRVQQLIVTRLFLWSCTTSVVYSKTRINHFYCFASLLFYVFHFTIKRHMHTASRKIGTLHLRQI